MVTQPIRCVLFEPPSDFDEEAPSSTTCSDEKSAPSQPLSQSQPTSAEAPAPAPADKNTESKLDIESSIFETSKDIPTVRSTTGIADAHLLKAGSANQNKLWPECTSTIRYTFLSSPHGGTKEQEQKVRDSIQEWTYYANVDLKEVKDASDADVRVRFDPQDGSWSYVGLDVTKVDAQAPTMNLAWVQKTGALSQNEQATILHEFGHTLGLLHEHQSPAHGAKATINVDAALVMYSTGQPWDDQQVRDQVINAYKNSDISKISNYSEVDPRSIMHCPQPKELTGFDRDVPCNTGLSDLDKAYMVLQYPRAAPHKNSPEWTFERALEVIGCPGSVRDAVLDAKRRGTDSRGNVDPTNIRKLLGDWSEGVQDRSRPNVRLMDNADDGAADQVLCKSSAAETLQNSIVAVPIGPSIARPFSNLLNSWFPGSESGDVQIHVREKQRLYDLKGELNKK